MYPAALIQGNHQNCTQFASSKHIDWLVRRLEGQESSKGTHVSDFVFRSPHIHSLSPHPANASLYIAEYNGLGSCRLCLSTFGHSCLRLYIYSWVIFQPTTHAHAHMRRMDFALALFANLGCFLSFIRRLDLLLFAAAAILCLLKCSSTLHKPTSSCSVVQRRLLEELHSSYSCVSRCELARQKPPSTPYTQRHSLWNSCKWPSDKVWRCLFCKQGYDDPGHYSGLLDNIKCSYNSCDHVELNSANAPNRAFCI